MKIQQALSFDDLMMIPKYSTVRHRDDVDISVDYGKGIIADSFFISSNMKFVTGPVMAAQISLLGGIGLMHRFYTIDEQCSAYNYAVKLWKDSVSGQTKNGHIGCSLGVKEEDKIRAQRLLDLGCYIFCIDIAHGDSVHCVEFTEWLANLTPKSLIISGNVATGSGAFRLYDAGADVIKAGVGSGSCCTTKINTANGAPSIYTLMDVAQVRGDAKFKFISDGGIKNPGDVCKSLLFADSVMIGNLFAGTDEAPGDTITRDGKQYKKHVGSSTIGKEKYIEGVEGYVPYRGPVKEVVDKLEQGVRSAMSYQGVFNLTDLKKDPQLIQITNSGLIESRPHDVTL